MAGVSSGTGLLFAFGGALQGLGQGMEKSGILDRETALKNLEMLAADARSNREIQAHHDDIATEEAGANSRNASTEAGAMARSQLDRKSVEKVAASNQAAEDARAASGKSAEAAMHPIKLDDGSLVTVGPGNVTQPVKDSAGNPVKGSKSVDDAIDQMRAYAIAVKANQTKDADGVTATDWNAVADTLDKGGFKDLAASARSEVKDTVNQDLWDSVRSKWEQKASDKASWFRSDKHDFGDAGRDAWINSKALTEYRARGGAGLPDDIKEAPDANAQSQAGGAAAPPAAAPATPAAPAAAAPAAPPAPGQTQATPSGNSYATDADVKAAARAGKITRAQALSILQSKFGYSP